MKLSEITTKLYPSVKKIYDNEKKFFDFFKLAANVLVRVSFGYYDCHVLWRHKETMNVQTTYIDIEEIQAFFDSLG